MKSKIWKTISEHSLTLALAALILTTLALSWPEDAKEWREFWREISGGAAVVLFLLHFRKRFHEKDDQGN